MLSQSSLLFVRNDLFSCSGTSWSLCGCLAASLSQEILQQIVFLSILYILFYKYQIASFSNVALYFMDRYKSGINPNILNYSFKDSESKNTKIGQRNIQHVAFLPSLKIQRTYIQCPEWELKRGDVTQCPLTGFLGAFSQISWSFSVVYPQTMQTPPVFLGQTTSKLNWHYDAKPLRQQVHIDLAL